MWQHAANIVVGLILIVATFIMTSAGLVSSQLLWLFVGAGVTIVVLSCWGLFDELVYESGQNHDDSDFIG